MPLPGHVFSQANGINNWGQVVGLSCNADFTDCHAFLWEDGELTDLNDLVDSDLLLTDARDIDDLGRITGRAFEPGRRPAYLAIPLPGPDGPAATEPARAAGHRLHPGLPRETARELFDPLSPAHSRLDGMDRR